MENLTQFISAHSQSAHLWIFSLLLLAGLNIPISEDLLLIIGGWLAYSLSLKGALYLYVWAFLGCCLSAWEAYWIGRLLGSRIRQGRFLRKFFSVSKLEKMRSFYARFGTLTFFVGRFIPFGIRNCLFISSGMGRMTFPRFISRDVPACLLSSGTLFSLAYCFGKNHQILYQYIQTYERVIGLMLVLTIALFIGFRWYRRFRKSTPKAVVR